MKIRRKPKISAIKIPWINEQSMNSIHVVSNSIHVSNRMCHYCSPKLMIFRVGIHNWIRFRSGETRRTKRIKKKQKQLFSKPLKFRQTHIRKSKNVDRKRFALKLKLKQLKWNEIFGHFVDLSLFVLVSSLSAMRILSARHRLLW